MSEVVDWESFLSALEAQLEYGKSPGLGWAAKDPVLMLKISVQEDLHGLLDK